jgi:effector-binding domain-containing protein
MAVSTEVRPLTTAARPTAVVAATTTWQEFPSLWRRLLDQVYECLATIDPRDRLHNIMLYKDDLPAVEVGVEVHVPFTPTGDVVVSALPAGPAAMAIHRGPYDRLGMTHDAIWEWCRSNDRRPVGPRWEIYGDWHENRSELVTEVYYLLSPD